ncbi:MAG: hypothetical protein E7252_09180 [Lachnospira sp.]|nr:hypothetical protein [Lachnospira sp.]
MIAGICLARDYSQISVYNITENQVETVKLPIGEDVTQIANECFADDVSRILEYMLSNAKAEFEDATEDKIVVAVENFTKEYLAKISESTDLPDIKLIGYNEAFITYMLNQSRELNSNVSVLFDFSASGLRVSELSIKSFGSKQLCYVENASYQIDINSEDVLISEQLLNVATELMFGKVISSVYLTGEGFLDNRSYDTFINYICERRRVFIGQNIYAQGAAYYALMADKLEANYVYACNERIKADVFVRIDEKGSEKDLRMVKCGSNWYYTNNQYDFILDDCNTINIYVDKLNEKEIKCYEIPLEDFPKRKPRTTRVGLELEFESDNTFTITIKDKGFGEFYKATKANVTTNITI